MFTPSAVLWAPSTGFLATTEVNANLSTNLAGLVRNGLWLEQLKAIGITLGLAIGGTVVIAMIVKAVLGLRPTIENEEAGLDEADHGESGYHYDEAAG